MFGNNHITGKAFFKNAKPNELLVASRFFTLQGEGPYRGHPAYFIRLAKCNLACSFCDTSFDSGDWNTFHSLLEEASQVIDNFYQKNSMATPAWAQNSPRKIVLVITGGEPSLQANLSSFLNFAQHHFQITQIESNGIILIPKLPDSTTLVVSPKCLEKKGKVRHYLKPNQNVLERANCLKFVLSAPEDEAFITYSEVPQWAHEWAEKTGRSVFVSPMNRYKSEPHRAKDGKNHELTVEERSNIHEVVSFWEPELLDVTMNQRNHEYAAEYCMKYGFILNLQIHLFASLP